MEKLDKSELMRLLKLPNHLRETMIAIIELKEATASQVSNHTGKHRATESAHLNQLERMGFLKRKYEHRNIYFSPLKL